MNFTTLKGQKKTCDNYLEVLLLLLLEIAIGYNL